MHCNAAQCNLSSCSTGPLIHAKIKEEVGIIWLLLTDGLCVPVTPSVYFNLQLSLIHIWGALSNQQYGIEGPSSWVQCITALRCILPVLSLPHCVFDDTPPLVALIRDQEDGIGGPSPTWVGLVVCSRSEVRASVATAALQTGAPSNTTFYSSTKQNPDCHKCRDSS